MTSISSVHSQAGVDMLHKVLHLQQLLGRQFVRDMNLTNQMIAHPQGSGHHGAAPGKGLLFDRRA